MGGEFTAYVTILVSEGEYQAQRQNETEYAARRVIQMRISVFARSEVRSKPRCPGPSWENPFGASNELLEKAMFAQQTITGSLQAAEERLGTNLRLQTCNDFRCVSSTTTRDALKSTI